MGAYIGYPYLEFHEYRAQGSMLQQSRGTHEIPVTHRYHEFPRGVI
jgi:hypothetical protein